MAARKPKRRTEGAAAPERQREHVVRLKHDPLSHRRNPETMLFELCDALLPSSGERERMAHVIVQELALALFRGCDGDDALKALAEAAVKQSLARQGLSSKNTPRAVSARHLVAVAAKSNPKLGGTVEDLAKRAGEFLATWGERFNLTITGHVTIAARIRSALRCEDRSDDERVAKKILEACGMSERQANNVISSAMSNTTTMSSKR